MSSAVAVQVAESVVAMVENSVSLTTREFTARRSYLEWDLDLKGLDSPELSSDEKLLIDVVAHTTGQEIEPGDRGSVRFTIPVDIGVRKKFGDTELDQTTGRVKLEEIDGLVLLVEQIALLFVLQRLPDELETVYDDNKGGVKILANPLRDHLREMNQFTGIVRVYLRVDRPLVEEVSG